jgi:tripartite-type tricarboxylate transporter receptor subunit TctC
VPTIAESGLDGFEASGWFGVFAPAHTPGATVSLLNYEINRALSEESLQRTLTGKGLLAAPGTPEEFRALIDTDRERWAHVLKTLAVH